MDQEKRFLDTIDELVERLRDLEEKPIREREMLTLATVGGWLDHIDERIEDERLAAPILSAWSRLKNIGNKHTKALEEHDRLMALAAIEVLVDDFDWKVGEARSSVAKVGNFSGENLIDWARTSLTEKPRWLNDQRKAIKGKHLDTLRHAVSSIEGNLSGELIILGIVREARSELYADLKGD